MKTIQIKSIAWIFGLLLSVSDIAGQRVITNHPLANGYPVIDLTGLSPLGCVLTATEAATRRTEMNAQTPSDYRYLEVGSEVSGENGTWNTKMSSLFQVMRADVTEGGGAYWADAYGRCKEYKGEGGTTGQWRLPTQRELMMIWSLRPQLLGKGGFVKGEYLSWCCTENYDDEAWYLDPKDGAMQMRRKANLSEARCVRDL